MRLRFSVWGWGMVGWRRWQQEHRGQLRSGGTEEQQGSQGDSRVRVHRRTAGVRGDRGAAGVRGDRGAAGVRGNKGQQGSQGDSRGQGTQRDSRGQGTQRDSRGRRWHRTQRNKGKTKYPTHPLLLTKVYTLYSSVLHVHLQLSRPKYDTIPDHTHCYEQLSLFSYSEPNLLPALYVIL